MASLISSRMIQTVISSHKPCHSFTHKEVPTVKNKDQADYCFLRAQTLTLKEPPQMPRISAAAIKQKMNSTQKLVRSHCDKSKHEPKCVEQLGEQTHYDQC